MLRGISRDYVMNELCKKLNIKVIEKNIEPYDVYDADEAFISGTPFCILPVTSLNSVKIGWKSWKSFSRILSQWSKNQKVDIKNKYNWDKENKKATSNLSPYKFND